MNDLFIKINELPDELIRLIKEYIPGNKFVFVNKDNYLQYHYLLKKKILKYESYIRDMINRDCIFVFENIVRENYEKWIDNKNYIYKNIFFKNYIYFIIYFCIENHSSKCHVFITEFVKQLGLCKNQHKKNIVKYIRWKN